MTTTDERSVVYVSNKHGYASLSGCHVFSNASSESMITTKMGF